MHGRASIILAGAGLWLGSLLLPTGAAAAPPSVRCPADPAAALAGFAAPVPDQAHALALLGCPDHLTRVRAIAALGDAPAPSAEAIAAIVAHLADPAGVVRQEALISTLRNADAVRLALLARMAADPPDAITVGADRAAAALWVIGRGSKPEPLPGLSRWQALFDPGSFSPDEAPATGHSSSLLSSETAPRVAALAERCRPDPITREGPGFGACRAGSPGADAYGASVAAEEELAPQVRAFEQAAAFAQVHSERWLARRKAIMAAIEKDMDEHTVLGLFGTPKDGDTSLADVLGSGGVGAALSQKRARAGAVAGSTAPPKPKIVAYEHRGMPVARDFSSGRVQAASTEFVASGAAAASLRELPRFPWPAPKPVLQQPIPLSALGNPAMTLGDVAEALRRRIQQADGNYEVGLFSGPPDGFVLLTRMERITDDGAPYPAPNRFTTRGNPSAGFWDAIRGLMAERPGHFRVIAFVVTSAVVIDPHASPLSIPFDRIGDASMLPAAVAHVPMGQRRVFALVYAFERRAGQPQQPWTDGAPSALTHLRLSGIGPRLGL